MVIELITYIGKIKNDTGIPGKAFLFNIMDEYSFDCILFIHDDIVFISLHDEEIKNNIDKEKIKTEILNKYTLEKLKQHENN
jgi:hypothetical protein